MCTFAHVLVMMFVLSLQSYQKGLTPQTGASPIFYFSRLACACIHVHARDEVLADNNNSLLFIDTPIGRVGVQNRTNFMNTLLKVAKEKQVILTFTPTEYDTNVKTILADNYNSFHSLTMEEGVTTIKSK